MYIRELRICPVCFTYFGQERYDAKCTNFIFTAGYLQYACRNCGHFGLNLEIEIQEGTNALATSQEPEL